MFNPLGNTGTITLKTQQNVNSNILVSNPFNSTQTINSNLFITNSQTIGQTLTVSGDSTFSTNLFVNDYVKLNYDQSITDGNKLGLLYATGTQTGLPLIASSQGHTVFKNPAQSGLTRLIASTTANNVFILVSDSDNIQNVNTNIQFNGIVTIQNTLNVDTLNVNNFNTLTKQLNIDNSIRITGSSTLLNSLTITGQTTILNSLLVTGSTTFQNNLRITGNTTIEGVLTASNAFFSGSSTVQDKLTIKGLINPSFGDEARLNFESGTKTSAITHYNTGYLSVLSDNLYISGTTVIDNFTTINSTLKVRDTLSIGEITNSSIIYDLDVRKNTSGAGVTTGISNRNNTGYSLLALNNDTNTGLVAFMNGSLRSSDGGTNTATIRNDTGGKIRIQNNNEFSYGDPENILGDPQQTPLTQGISTSNQFTFKSTVTADGFIYVGGEYVCNTTITIKNFNGSNSSFTLPSTNLYKRAFIIEYNLLGSVNNVWFLPSDFYSDCKNLYVGANTLYICGSYSHTALATKINNLNGTVGKTDLPITNASTGFYGGYIVGFLRDTKIQNKLNIMYGGSNQANQNFYSSVVEDAFGNVFGCGTIISNNNAPIRNLLNVTTGLTLNLTNVQNGFIIRWDSNNNYTGHWGWNISSYACFINDMAIVPSGNALYVAMSIYNLGTAITIPNWNGGGSSGYQILASSSYSTAYWSSVLIRFTGVSTIASPTINGRQSFGNTNQTFNPFPISSVCYSIVHNIIYWSCPVSAVNQIAFFTEMTDTAYNLTLSPPQSQNTTNVGILTFIIANTTAARIVTYPGSIWSNSSTYAENDFIYRIRENPNNGNVYLQGGIYSNNTPSFMGFYETQSRIQFPFNTGQGTSYYSAFSIMISYSTVRGMSYIPFSLNQSYTADICFPANNRAIIISTINNHTSQFIRNFDQYNSSYSLPVTSTYNTGILVDYALTKIVSTFFTSKGVGFGRQNAGIAELEVEKGIYTSSFIQCNEIRINDYNQPLKFTDSIGREMGSLCRAWICLDGVRTFQPVIKASMNVRYVDKTAPGKYRIFFSQYSPHDRFSTFVSSTSYNSGNYSVFPFIDTNATPGFPAFKFVYGIGVSVNNTSGTGFDLAEVNVCCFW
jgi:hypothetical protein